MNTGTLCKQQVALLASFKYIKVIKLFNLWNNDREDQLRFHDFKVENAVHILFIRRLEYSGVFVNCNGYQSSESIFDTWFVRCQGKLRDQVFVISIGIWKLNA